MVMLGIIMVDGNSGSDDGRSERDILNTSVTYSSRVYHVGVVAANVGQIMILFYQFQYFIYSDSTMVIIQAGGAV